MLLLMHVTIALSSIIWTGLAFFAPSSRKLNISYALIAGTVGTGAYLVITTRSPLMQSCLAGLAYLGVALFEIFATRMRLVAQKSE